MWEEQTYAQVFFFWLPELSTSYEPSFIIIRFIEMVTLGSNVGENTPWKSVYLLLFLPYSAYKYTSQQKTNKYYLHKKQQANRLKYNKRWEAKLDGFILTSYFLFPRI